MLVKNQTLTLTCETLGADLEGICRHEGQTLFVTGALPGETLEAKVLQMRPNYGYAKIMRLLKPSPDRREPFCPVYVQCGGCSGQHMCYEATLRAKRSQVFDCLTRIGGLSLSDTDVPPVLGAENATRYRNKTSLPVGGTAEHPTLGFFKRRSHDIVDIDRCPIALNDMAPVLAAVRAWMAECGVAPYQEESHTGLLRHVIVRANRAGDILVLLVAARDTVPGAEKLAERLRRDVPGFRALHLSENRQRNNVILGETSRRLYGDDAIDEVLLGLTFAITPLSFFQVHPAQTERLYAQSIAYAQLIPEDTVVDAYAGAGTIALCMAPHCKRVIGLEIVPQAVESARINAKRNGIINAEFYAASVEERLPALVADGLRPDVVVLDPPRKGVEPEVVRAILLAAPRRVVYVSCHVPTQARDVALFTAGGYRFAGCQPVDMFPYASGIENVLALERV